MDSVLCMCVVLGSTLRGEEGWREGKKEGNFEVEMANSKVRIYLVVENYILGKVRDPVFFSLTSLVDQD